MTRKPPVRGTRELLAAYRTMPWLRAVTHKIASSIASVSWRVMAVERGGRPVRIRELETAGFIERTQRLRSLAAEKQTAVRELEDHPILDLLADGNNGFQLPHEFWRVTQGPIDLVGENFWLLERAGTRVTRIYPIPPHWVQDVPKPRAGGMYELQMPEHGGQGKSVEVAERDILWFRDPDMENPYQRGAGTARALADELDTGEFAAKHLAAFFYNGARPDLLAVIEGAKEEELLRLKQSWMAEHRGFWKAGLPRFMNRRIEVKDLSRSFAELQLTQIREYERDTIVNVYGVPPEIFGILKSSNRATIEAADFLFANWVLVPRLELLRGALQKRLMREFDERLVLTYRSPVPRDKEIAREIMRSAQFAFKVNDFRRLAGEDPLPGDEGEIFYVPFNMFPVERHGEVSPLNQSEGGANDSGDEGQPAEAARRPGSRKRSVKVFEDEEERERIAQAAEPAMLIGLLTPSLALTVDAFGRQTLDEIGAQLEFDDGVPVVIDFLGATVGERLEGVNQTTREQIDLLLAELSTLGLPPDQMREEAGKAVEQLFAGFETARLPKLARTESVLAANVGILAGITQAGVDAKMWISMRDAKVRDTHRALDSTVVGANQHFVSPSGARALHPGGFGVAAEDVNCRCVITFVQAGRTAFDSEEKREARWQQFERDRAPFERAIAQAGRRAFAAQRDAVLAALRASAPQTGARP